MSLKDKMKTYNFWISLASAVVLIVRIIGDKFNFFVDAGLIMDITTGLCSIFVILGILSVPKSKEKTQDSSQTQTEETIEIDASEQISNIISNIKKSKELVNKMENFIENKQNISALISTNTAEKHEVENASNFDLLANTDIVIEENNLAISTEQNAPIEANLDATKQGINDTSLTSSIPIINNEEAVSNHFSSLKTHLDTDAKEADVKTDLSITQEQEFELIKDENSSEERKEKEEASTLITYQPTKEELIEIIIDLQNNLKMIADMVNNLK